MEFTKAPEIDELDSKSAHALCDGKHFALDLRGAIPGGLPAHCRIDSEDQAARGLIQCRYARSLCQERVNVARRRTLGRKVFCHGGILYRQTAFEAPSGP